MWERERERAERQTTWLTKQGGRWFEGHPDLSSDQRCDYSHWKGAWSTWVIILLLTGGCGARWKWQERMHHGLWSCALQALSLITCHKLASLLTTCGYASGVAHASSTSISIRRRLSVALHMTNALCHSVAGGHLCRSLVTLYFRCWSISSLRSVTLLWRKWWEGMICSYLLDSLYCHRSQSSRPWVGDAVILPCYCTTMERRE